MPNQTSSVEIHPENYRFLQEHVYTHVGIVLEEDKHYLFESRLAPIVRQLGLGSINELCVLLKGPCNADIAHRVAEAMTTNETYFFREPAQYDAIQNVLVPRLIAEHRAEGKLRFWSAAASTGQEAYSLAILLLEAGLTHLDVQILGTDISPKVIERARSGKYQQIEVNRGLPAALLIKHFTQLGTEWQLNEAARRMVTFERFDLRNSMRALGPFHLVLCRNVMIYFDVKTRQRIVEELRGTLFRGGWLLLGGVESVPGAETCFDRYSEKNNTIYVAR